MKRGNVCAKKEKEKEKEKKKKSVRVDARHRLYAGC